MDYLTLESIKTSLGDANWASSADANLSVMLANAWLSAKALPRFDTVPSSVLMAGALIARAIAEGELMQGRTEGIVASKSVKAGEVSTSKTFASGADGMAISAAEQQALALIAPYLIKPSAFGQIKVGRS